MKRHQASAGAGIKKFFHTISHESHDPAPAVSNASHSASARSASSSGNHSEFIIYISVTM